MDTGHFQSGGGHAAAIGRAFPGKAPSQHLRWLIGGLYQPIAEPTMLGTLADRVDALKVGLQMVVDGDAAINLEARSLRQLSIWPDANRHHYCVGRDRP